MAVGLDIAIARLGTRRLDTHGKELVVCGSESHGIGHILLERILVEDELVARHDNHHRVVVDLRDAVVRPGHAGSRVAGNRLYKNMVLCYLRQLLPQEIKILGGGADIDVIGRDDLRHAVPRLLHLRSTDAKEIYKLFWTTLAAARPQALPSSSCKNETIVFVNV